MKIKTLSIQNFKAFGPEQRFDFDSKNVLIYGNNGAGKSSVYYALYTFLQSSSPGKDWQKYFDTTHAECLANIYTDSTRYRSFVRLIAGRDQTYELSADTAPDALASTHADITLANLASDFMNYRLLFNFYNFRNSVDADLWDIFEKEIFPHWTFDDLTGTSFEQQLTSIRTRLKELSQVTQRNSKTGLPNTIGYKKPEYEIVTSDVREFNRRFAENFRLLKPDIQTLLNDYFLPNEDVQVDIEPVGRLAIMYGYRYGLDRPNLFLTLTVNGYRVARPQTFLNEARLTALALAIRLAMVGQRFKGVEGRDDLRILVLDDLLISLDMSNRMKVIKYLQENDDFKNYQLVILTHDKGFYEILRKSLASDGKFWKWFELYEQEKIFDKNGQYRNAIYLEAQDSLTKAREFLKNHDYEACALYLRKKTEEILRIYFDPELQELTRYTVFEKLATTLNSVEKDVNERLVNGFKKILKNPHVTEERLRKIGSLRLISSDNMTEEQRKEVGQTNAFKNDVVNYLLDHYMNNKAQDDRFLELVRDIDGIRSRIMNAGAHAGDEPLYRDELKAACIAVAEFEKKVQNRNQRTE